jgi:acyl carrier protein
MIELNSEEIREVVEIAIDRELDSFDMDTNFYEEYEMDSLGAVAMVVEVQKRYDVRIPDERMPDVRTGNQLKLIIQELHEAATLEGAEL